MPIIHELAALYPSTKFVSIVSDHCIENYPDKNCPTMLVYRGGAMMGQIVGLGAMGNEKATLRGEHESLFREMQLKHACRASACCTFCFQAPPAAPAPRLPN